MVARGGHQGGEDIDETSAKHLLDSIGEKVYKKVHGAALQRSNGALQGILSLATFEKKPETQQTPKDPCDLNHKYHTTVTSGYDKENPCKDRPEVRFSYTEGAECNKSKVKGNEGNSEGACAPYRRLHVCDQNLELIKPKNITTHNLLVDVCLAAKFEAESLKTYRGKYQLTNHGFHTNICTELARSFADIGDIIRGKDLYRGNNKEKDRLEDNLKKIFKQLYEELTKNNKNEAIKTHYQDDDPNYYKLRNAWWEANRQEVWKAITCGAGGSKYFRHTCGTGTPTDDKCRCAINDVPTYFDYVPQYLRWFEEWAEDFCRKRKHKLKDVKTNCRGENGTDRYCSGNGLDCTKTIRAKYIYAIGSECTKCSFLCGFYKKWIDNQKKEFLKQKKKCENEMLSKSKKKQSTKYNVYEGYDKEFYKILKSNNVGNLDNFLDLLSNENECKNIDGKGGKIDFNNTDNKTFSHSEYCEECPDCGVEKKDNGEFQKKEKNNGECKGGKRYEIPNHAKFNEINVLSFGDKGEDRETKLKKFCETKNGSAGGGGGSNSEIKELTEQWKCYEEKDIKKLVENDLEYNKEVKGSGGICILQKTNGEENGKKQKTFNDFFHFWVRHLLNDSIEWREKLDKCLKNGTKILCKNGCNKNCKCYESWVEEKKKEWGEIKKHFDTQEDIKNSTGVDPIVTLEYVLEEFYFPLIQEAYGDAQAIEGIKKTLHSKENQQTDATDTKNKTLLDYLLHHEEQDADKCVRNNPDKDCPKKPPTGGPGGVHSDTASEDITHHDSSHDESEGSEDEEEEEEEDKEEEGEDGEDVQDDVAEEDTAKEEGSSTTETQLPDACNIVKTLFESTKNFEDACPTKYGPKAPTSWKCIPSGDKAATSGEGDSGPSRKRRDTTGGESTTSSSATTGGKDGATGGSVCVPPRRRKLYVGGLTKWAEIQLKSQAGGDKATQEGDGNGGSETQPQGGTPSQPDPKVELLKAFVESAAVETFFLWDRYKKEWMAQKLAEQGLTGGLPGLSSSVLGEEEEQPPQSKLQQTGEIPPDFLRQMFYTLGDYRDILVGNSTHILEAVTIGSNNETGKEIMKAIQEKIQQILPQNGDKPGKTSGTTPQALWSKYAEPIWNGMIYALTYKDNTDSGAKGKPPTQDTQVKTKLWDENSKKPKKNAGPESNIDYTYENVVLKEDESGAKTTGGDTPLTNFISRPTYFRYLEEWGETFCRQRTKRLDKIKEDCEVDDDDNKCDGDGFYCTQKVTNEDETIKGFDCSTCARHCRFYKKWIERKKDEFTEQKNAYSKQKEKCKEGSESSKQFCGTLKDDAAAFLNKLKSGPCKNESGEGPIKFDDQDKTFKHTEYCGPCSQFTVDCKNCNGGHTKGKCKNKTITEEDIKTMNDHNHVVMGVIDNSAKGFDDGLEACRDKCIFEGIRNDVWKCGKVCGLDVCGLKNANGKNYDQIILIRALFKRWVENFFDDYKKIKHKISHCINNGNGSICTSDCGKKCNCVKDWITKKKDEWKNIKERFREQYKKPDNYNVRSVLEEVIPENHLVNTKNKVIKISKFDNSCACSASAISTNGNEEDAIDCMIKNLEKKN
ncbi:hypothetical protein PFNF54_00750 [Plasmodium falciparum NF54]|uniref:Erythrocyte membrane protein 1 n=1 Tax=Plasmodium falciparum (isolate NF54) TaxID=5843 RepID=W7KLL6_PLAFO|nr:hypothetical protein PFNF54_00750 [Plasmodium falciparum NF54]